MFDDFSEFLLEIHLKLKNQVVPISFYMKEQVQILILNTNLNNDYRALCRPLQIYIRGPGS